MPNFFSRSSPPLHEGGTAFKHDKTPPSQQLLQELPVALDSVQARQLHEAITQQRKDEARRLAIAFDAGDLAHFMNMIRAPERRYLLSVLGSDFNFDVLSHLDETVRDDVVDGIDPYTLAQAVQQLDLNDAVYLLEDMPEEERQRVLARVPEMDRAFLRRSLEYPEKSAGRLLRSDVVVVSPAWTVGEILDYMRETDDLPSEFFELFVINDAFIPLGSVALNRVLRSPRTAGVVDIMEKDIILIPATMNQEEVAYQFERYDLVSAAVVDEKQRLIGVIMAEDVVGIVNKEAEEDIRRLAGVGDETFSDSVISVTRNRFSWLFVNLLTAILASVSIYLFDGVIEHMVAVAILMPITASMAGNAAIQTMTVTVRALATHHLVAFNARQVVTREVIIGSLNGVMFSVIVALVSGFLFNDFVLGSIFAASMIISMVVAALTGILIPLILNRMDIDPAIASSVFVTTVTDLVGFVSFLGIATIILL